MSTTNLEIVGTRALNFRAIDVCTNSIYYLKAEKEEVESCFFNVNKKIRYWENMYLGRFMKGKADAYSEIALKKKK